MVTQPNSVQLNNGGIEGSVCPPPPHFGGCFGTGGVARVFEWVGGLVLDGEEGNGGCFLVFKGKCIFEAEYGKSSGHVLMLKNWVVLEMVVVVVVLVDALLRLPWVPTTQCTWGGCSNCCYVDLDSVSAPTVHKHVSHSLLWIHSQARFQW